MSKNRAKTHGQDDPLGFIRIGPISERLDECDVELALSRAGATTGADAELVILEEEGKHYAIAYGENVTGYLLADDDLEAGEESLAHFIAMTSGSETVRICGNYSPLRSARVLNIQKFSKCGRQLHHSRVCLRPRAKVERRIAENDGRLYLGKALA